MLLLLVCVGSIYAADNAHSLGDTSDSDDLDLDEDLDDFDDEELDDDDDFDDDEDDEDLDDDDDEDDEDEDDDEDLDDDDEDLDDEDLEDDDNETYYSLSDFDYLQLKIISYLDRYGNCSDYNWTESEEFLSEYQIYLSDPSNYTLNESSEGYQTYLKIYDSIISTFPDYNLTENETDYLKFMVIFYLNTYGNVSANYTWNESESFENFTFVPPFYLGAFFLGKATALPQEFASSHIYSPMPDYPLNNSTAEVNQTSADSQQNQTCLEAPSSEDFSIFLVLLVIILMVLVFV